MFWLLAATGLSTLHLFFLLLGLFYFVLFSQSSPASLHQLLHDSHKNIISYGSVSNGISNPLP